jgi:hypothetical protein
MTYPRELLTWHEQVSTHLPHLTKSQAQMLAWYSLAVTIVQSCGMSSVAYLLSQMFQQPENTVRQRLRETLYDAADKRGSHRREIDVVLCFAPLLRWVLAMGRSPDQRLWLALDATTLKQRFTVLSVSVLVGRCAIPVAWTVLPACEPGAWKPHWQGLLTSLATPCDDLQVIVMTDRGLYAKWLFDAIRQRGWHPLMRLTQRGSVCLTDSGHRLTLKQLAQTCQGRCWHGKVTCFTKPRQLACTLLVMWDHDQQDAWLLVTDLPPTTISPTWYGLRMAIEAGFKALKSGGFHWERTRMTDPARAERLWLVLALASLRAATLAPPDDETARETRPYPRLSLFKRGMIRQLAAFVMTRLYPNSGQKRKMR